MALSPRSMEKTSKSAIKSQFTDFYCVLLKESSFCSEQSVGEVLKIFIRNKSVSDLDLLAGVPPQKVELQAVRPLLIFLPTLTRKIQRLVVSC